jgi:hypothetical protein
VQFYRQHQAVGWVVNHGANYDTLYQRTSVNARNINDECSAMHDHRAFRFDWTRWRRRWDRPHTFGVHEHGERQLHNAWVPWRVRRWSKRRSDWSCGNPDIVCYASLGNARARSDHDYCGHPLGRPQ